MVGPRTAIDPIARKLYSDALIILSYWWDHGPQDEDDKKLAGINDRVGRTVAKDAYIPIAPSYLRTSIQGVRSRLSEVIDAEDRDKDPKRLELAKEVVQLSNDLRKHGFDWKSVANRRIQRAVLICLYKSENEEIRKRRDSLVQSIFEPYPE